MKFKSLYSEGKTTYYVNGVKFYNDAGMRNGKQRAVDYCLANFIDPAEIITFDSMLECERYEYLKELEHNNTITNLRHHISMPILSSYTNYNGDEIPELRYNADFIYNENGKNIVEDVKGLSLYNDSRFECVKQIFDYIYKDKTYIRIVIKRNGEWVEWRLGESKKPSKLIKKQSNKIKELQKELHKKEIEENLKQRELKRLKELRELDKLSSSQRKRKEELENKYEIK